MHLPWLPQLHRCFQSSLLCRFRCPRGLQWCSQHLQSRYPDWLHGPVVVELQTTGHMHSSHRWIRSLKQELQPTCQKLRQQSLWEFPTGLKKNQSKGQGKTKPRFSLRTIGHFKCNFMIGISFGWGKLTPCGQSPSLNPPPVFKPIISHTHAYPWQQWGHHETVN